jgi:hypothetical protein
MAVSVSLNPVFQLGPSQALFQIPLVPNSSWDVTPDGTRFLFPVLADESREPFTLVVNWPSALR